MTAPPEGPQRQGPVVIGYDGSAVSERALQEAAALLAPRPALVVVVWEPGRAFEAALSPLAMEFPLPAVDLRSAFELDRAAYEAAERTAQQGAARARSMGLPADALVVADETTVAETLVRVAGEQDALALVIGAHTHGALSEVVLGSTSRDVLRHAPCAVVVVREKRDRRREGAGS
jgi:nucleotide-binding universal stress UspA family protein